MMFNGLMVYGDSDTSDVTKESIGSSLAAGSGGSRGSAGSGGSGGEARSRCLEHKLAATLQVLKNKEETVRVQAESLALAEARIAALAARLPPSPPPPAAPPATAHTLQSTRSSADGCCVDTSDFTGQAQEEEEVVVLRDNLSIIEDLYRDCFYESCKQEETIEVLRSSVADVRRRERSLQRALHARHPSLWPTHRCQDIALEVENLKSEISNFLNSSNHDSGMWERAEGEGAGAGEVADDLQHIAQQLLQLRDLLAEGCSCGLEDENMKLKRINQKLEVELEEVRGRARALEAALQDKENIQQQQQHQILVKDQQLASLQQQLSAAADHRRDSQHLHEQVERLQEELRERSEALSAAQRAGEQLRQELARARTGKENDEVRAELSALSGEVGRWRLQLEGARRRLLRLEDTLRGERERGRHLHRHYQDKAREAESLRGALEEAHARGAALCRDSQRAVAGLRRWMQRARHTHREQKQTIEEQDKLIRLLQRQADAGSEPCCSRALRVSRTTSGTPAGASGTASCERCRSTSVSDASGRSAPTPPRRDRRKLASVDRECQCGARGGPRCEAGSQRPARAHAHTHCSLDDLTDVASPAAADEALAVLERVERAHTALAEARRRWRREPHAEPT